MKISKKNLLLIALILFNPITGLGINSLRKNGAFVSWALIGTPPERAEKILAYDGSYNVLVLTASQEEYEGDGFLGMDQNGNTKIFSQSTRWSKISKEEEISYSSWDYCKNNLNTKGGRHIKDEVDNLTCDYSSLYTDSYSYVAIDKDGNVWLWRHEELIVSNFINMILFLVIFSITSIVIGRALLKEVKKKTVN